MMFLFASMAVTTPASAAQDFGPYQWSTGDGRWDGKLEVSSNGQNVAAKIDVWTIETPVSIRLCSHNGNCTGFKSVSAGATTVVYFTNMSSGTYYGDIISNHPTYEAAGEIKYTVY